MKKVFYTLLIAFLAVTTTAQTIPNNDFETTDGWQLVMGQGNYVEELAANNSNGDRLVLPPVSGSKFLRLQNNLQQGQVGMIANRFAMSQRPTDFSFHVGYLSGDARERFAVMVFMWKYNATTRYDTVCNFATLLPQQDGQVSPWAVVNIDLSNSYKGSDTPDSCMIAFIVDMRLTTSGTILASANTVLMVDKVEFAQQQSSGISWAGIRGENSISINKAYYSNGQLHVDMENTAATGLQLSVSNINGQVVFSKDMRLNGNGRVNESFDLGALPSGIYILGIVSDKGYLESKKFFVR